MGVPRLFKLSKPKQFNYRPLYYNQDKEELEERIRNIEAEVRAEQQGGEYSPRIRKGYMREKFTRGTKAKKDSNRRLLIIMVILAVLAYVLFYM